MGSHLNIGGIAGPATTSGLPEGIAALSRGSYFREASLDMMMSILIESASQMVGVERASIWALTGDQQELRCLAIFQRSSGHGASGLVIGEKEYPRYFRALRSGHPMAADDALLDPVMGEFAGDYLPRFNVTAILDTPIHIRGDLQGVLRLEQVGERTPWTMAQRLFAQAVANLVSLALVDYEAEEARRDALAANERLRAVLDVSPEAMCLADCESGHILDLNLQAERLLDRSREELAGKHYCTLLPREQQPQIMHAYRRLLDGAAVQPLVTEFERGDGVCVAVEVTAEVSVLSDGRRMALSVFRPLVDCKVAA